MKLTPRFAWASISGRKVHSGRWYPLHYSSASETGLSTNKKLLITSATFFQPDSPHKHSDLSQENSTLGEFCLATMKYARGSVARESFVHFLCYTIIHNPLVRIDLRTWRTVVHGLSARPWRPMIQVASYGFLKWEHGAPIMSTRVPGKEPRASHTL